MNNEQRDELLQVMHDDVLETKTKINMLIDRCPIGARNTAWSKALLVMQTATLAIIAWLHGRQ